MAIGHISLGDVGAQRPYMLEDIRGYQRSLANQMRAGIAQGENEYGNLDSWSAWIQEDWQGGIGRIKPHREGAGYLYSDVDSRVPEQLILPPLLHQSDRRDTDATIADCRYMPEDIAGVLGAGTYAMKFTTPAAFVGTRAMFRVYAQLAGQTLTVNIHADSSDAPGSSIASSTISDNGNGGQQFAWYGLSVSGVLSVSTSYWFAWTVPSGAQLAYGSSDYARVAMQNSGGWANLTGKYILFSCDFFNLDNANSVDYPGTLFRLGNDLYLTHRDDIYKYSSANDNWTLVGAAGTGNITCAVVWDTSVYLGKASGDFYTMNTAETIAASGGGEDAKLFAVWNGYLYRAFENDLYYSANGTTWTGPIEVPSDAYEIRGLAGMGDYMHMATDEGLYYLAPGDIVVGVTRWGSIDSENGRNMVHHMGNLYIPVNDRILEYSATGTIRDIWTHPEELPLRRAGKIHGLYSTNTWLLALVGNIDNPSIPLIWAWQEEGWHPWIVGAEQPPANFASYTRTPQTMFLDRVLNRLWSIDGRGVTWWVATPDYALNPYNDSDYKFMPFGWIEWDWFDGPIREVRKDYESITVMGENFSSTRYIKVYWRDDDSTDWELLGTVDSNNEELRWVTGGGTRPNTRRLKIALHLATNDADETPRIQAIRVKYHLMVSDWFLWNLRILCSGRTSSHYQQLLDDDLQDYTAAQQITHLNTLATQVAPFLLTDLNGSQYEVKVTAATFQPTKFQYVNSTKSIEGVYILTLEQTTQGVYAG